MTTKQGEEGNEVLDTDIIRTTFRIVVQRSVVLSLLIGWLYAAIFFNLGDGAWRWVAISSLCNVPLYCLTGKRRRLPVFLAGVLLFLTLITTFVTHLSLHAGHEAGFQYLLLVAIPIVMVSGRIELVAKWLLIGCLTLYILWLDGAIAALGQKFTFTEHVTEGFHNFNLVIVAIVTALIAQHYFVLVSEYQGIIRRQASIDPLTGLLNRRRLLESANKAIAKAHRFQTPLSVIMCDVDHFKLVNDQYGHEAGDVVLRRVSKILSDTARQYDIVCRWGGEEFLLVLPETGLENAGIIAERIRLTLATTPINIGTCELKVTITMGVAELGVSEELTDTVQRADETLYAGKFKGRNQVVLSRP
jgi:diguanylate cyclase (GGDEF)-like protein